MMVYGLPVYCLNSNLAGIKIYFDIKSINNNLDWETATFNDIYAAMTEPSLASLKFEPEAQVITEYGFSNGGTITLYKGSPWRGHGLLSIYKSGVVMVAIVNGRDTLILRQINLLS